MTSERNQEFLGLFLVITLLLFGFALVTLTLTRELPQEIFALPGALAALFFFGHLAMRLWVPKSDPFFLPIVSCLISLGLIMIYRLKPELVLVQVLWIGVGTFALITTLMFFRNYNELENYKYIFAIFGLLLLLSPIFVGKEVHGAKLWLKFGSFSFQPSEVAKILIVIFLAAYLKEKGELLSLSRWKRWKISLPEPKHWGPLLTMWLISLAILIFQKDLGSSLLFFGLFLGMLYIATGRVTYVLIGLGLFLAGAASCYYLFPHVATRVDVWIDPWVDVAGRGYQIVQSLFAISSGGLAGSGLGKGFPQTIPAVHTDFIFSALAEETGFFGAAGVIVLYLLLTYRGLRLSLSASDGFGELLASGLTTVFGLQTLVIIGGVTKAIPLTGVTLPFMSYGGSSILSNFILLGLLLAVSQKTATGGESG
ncbi:MAG TPA: FtsW/RodA/SpoVE family cell cycle protein [Candidatus Subteraquimicrobiales bacterium]